MRASFPADRAGGRVLMGGNVTDLSSCPRWRARPSRLMPGGSGCPVRGGTLLGPEGTGPSSFPSPSLIPFAPRAGSPVSQGPAGVCGGGGGFGVCCFCGSPLSSCTGSSLPLVRPGWRGVSGGWCGWGFRGVFENWTVDASILYAMWPSVTPSRGPAVLVSVVVFCGLPAAVGPLRGRAVWG